MLLTSTNAHSTADLRRAVTDCYAPDGGLYLPDVLPRIPQAYFNNIADMSLQEIAYVVVSAFLCDETPRQELKKVVDDAFSFPIPLVGLESGERVLELFNGPTWAFKDISARFMARYLQTIPAADRSDVLLLVATTGNTGAAIAQGFAGLAGVKVLVLYPRGAMSPAHVASFAGRASNVFAAEVAGTIADCKRMVRMAVTDEELRAILPVVSGNTHNIIRLLPQVVYFFHAYARLRGRLRHPDGFTLAIPCGNLSNLTSAVMAWRMGVPVGHIVAGCTANDSFVRVLDGTLAPADVTGESRRTLAPAMDSGYPTNLPRLLRLYGGSVTAMRADISAYAVGDTEIADTVRDVYAAEGYMLDPHTAVAMAAMRRYRRHNTSDAPAVVVATAHPAKSAPEMHRILGHDIELTSAQKCFNDGRAAAPTLRMAPSLQALKKYIFTNII